MGRTEIPMAVSRGYQPRKKTQYEIDFENAYEELNNEFPGLKELEIIIPPKGGTGEVIPTGYRGTF